MAASPTRVLILDSRSEWRERLARAFERAGGSFELCGAADLATARARLREWQPDLLIASWRLPDGGALELLPGAADAPFATLIVDHPGGAQAAVAALRAGALDYLIDGEALVGELPARAAAALIEWRQRHDRRAAERALEAENAELRQRLAACADELARVSRSYGEEHQMLGSLMESIPDSIYFKDTAARFTLINRAQAHVLGVADPADAIGTTDHDYQPASENPSYVEEDRAVLERGETIVGHEGCFPTRDGEPRWFSSTKAPIRDAAGQIVGLVGISRDITKRKLAEESRWLAEAQYRTLVEQLPAVVYLAPLDRASHTSYISPAVEALLGYTMAEWRGEPDLWLQLLQPDDREAVLARLDRAIVGREPFIMEYRLVARDGHTVWVRDEAQLVPDEAGQPWVIQGVLIDITERKLAERRSVAFSALGQQLNAATNASEAARVVAATADEILGWDAFVLTLYSAEQDSVEQVLMYDLVDGQRREIMPKFRVGPATLLQRHTIDHGARLFGLSDPLLHELCPEFFGDEERSTESLMFVPIRRDAKVVGVLSIQSYTPGAYTTAGLDVLQALADHIGGAIERIQAEQQRHASEQRYRALFEHAADAIFLEDLEDRIVDVNPRACALLGYTREQLLGMRVPDVIAPELHVPGGVVRSEIAAEPSGPFESINIHRDGRRIPVEITCAPFYTPAGGLMFSIVRDITERKRAEAGQRFLSEASALLGNSLEPEVTLATFTELAVPFLADWCAVHLLQPDQSIKRVAEHFGDPAKQEQIEAFHRFRPRGRDGDEGGYVEVIRTGQPVREPDLLAAAAKLGQPQLEGYLRALEFSSFMSVPLTARGRTFGALSFGALGSGRHYGQADQALAEQLAYRAALSIDNARLFAELRDSQARYQSSEERFRTLIQDLHVGVLLQGPSAEMLLSNRAALNLLGLTEDQLLGLTSFDPAWNVIHEDGSPFPGHDHPVPQVIATRRPVRDVVMGVFRPERGDRIWLLVNAEPQLTAEGHVRQVICTFSDITERRQIEAQLRELNNTLERRVEERTQALRAAEARYRMLVEQLPAITYISSIDSHDHTLYISPQVETMLGYRPAEWIGEPDIWKRYMHPDDRPRIQAEQARAHVEGRPRPAEYRLIARDGRVRWFRDEAVYLDDDSGSPRAVQGILYDITERKQAEQDLRLSELRYRTLIEHMSEGLLQADQNDVIQFANASFCQLLGYSPDELIGQVAFDLLLREEDRDFMFATNQQRRRGVSDKYEIQLRKKSGQLIWVQISGAPVIDASGKVVGTIGVHTDISERRRMEDALAEERALLALRVEERTAELRAVNTELARAARLKDEFLASMSHELRTPLNTILGMSETIAEQIYGPVTGEQSEALESILESGRHLLALINDILDLSKIEADQLSLELGPVLVEEICQSSLVFVRQTAQQKRQRLGLQIDPQVDRIQADSRRLTQMLVNLLSNAVKFTPDGGSVQLEVAGDRARQQVQFSVTDTGIGIAPADLSRLFQPFIQLDSRLARQYAGTGLGLALVARMARLHGGSVSVESELGQGSRFTISLPWHALGEAGHAGEGDLADPLDATPELAIANVLILEDSPAAAAQITRYLDELGIGSTVHTRGAMFFEQVLELRPEAIILDIRLPDLSGWDVLVRLKADPQTRAIPVLILSVVDDVARALALGAAEHLVKPITRPQLIAALRKLGSSPVPVAPPEPPPGPPAAPPEPPATRPRILLADDNPDNKMMFSRYLRAKGYDVVLAENGPQAIALATAAPPDLILMDIQMPEIDGLEATRQIRANPALARVPIVALTALAMPGDRERCLAAGMDDYLSKPIVLQTMLDMINAHITRAAARDTDEHH
jgi:PAS domain S-box-containing protein